MAAQDALIGQPAVLGETCKMAATSADRRKLAGLGAGRGDWLCIGTSLDALGAGGASPPPGPFLVAFVLVACAVRLAAADHSSGLKAPSLAGVGDQQRCHRRRSGSWSASWSNAGLAISGPLGRPDTMALGQGRGGDEVTSGRSRRSGWIGHAG